MDFKNNKHYVQPENVRQFLANKEMPNNVGVAIIEVQLDDYTQVRKLISEHDFFNDKGALSYTASGKIRLVRERIFG